MLAFPHDRISELRKQALLRRIHYSILQNEFEFDTEVTIYGCSAGYIRSERLGTKIKLCGLFVQESLQLPWPFSPRLLIKIFGSRRPISLRGCGIGRELLFKLLAYAEKAGVTEIYGDVVAKDAAATPYLLSLYERYGFFLFEPGKDSLSGTIKRVIWKPMQTPTSHSFSFREV